MIMDSYRVQGSEFLVLGEGFTTGSGFGILGF